jgi:hypothetical protein
MSTQYKHTVLVLARLNFSQLIFIDIDSGAVFGTHNTRTRVSANGRYDTMGPAGHECNRNHGGVHSIANDALTRLPGVSASLQKVCVPKRRPIFTVATPKRAFEHAGALVQRMQGRLIRSRQFEIKHVEVLDDTCGGHRFGND